MRDTLAFAGTLLLVLAIFAAGIWLNATGLGVPLGMLLLLGVPAWALLD